PKALRVFGELLGAARLARGLTQVELAGLAEVSETTVARAEKGKRKPSEKVAVRLIEELRFTVTAWREAMLRIQFEKQYPGLPDLAFRVIRSVYLPSEEHSETTDGEAAAASGLSTEQIAWARKVIGQRRSANVFVLQREFSDKEIVDFVCAAL